MFFLLSKLHINSDIIKFCTWLGGKCFWREKSRIGRGNRNFELTTKFFRKLRIASSKKIGYEKNKNAEKLKI